MNSDGEMLAKAAGQAGNGPIPSRSNIGDIARFPPVGSGRLATNLLDYTLLQASSWIKETGQMRLVKSKEP
jgi:hypothetical protein